MPNIFKKIPNAKLIIIGSGPQKKDLENKINKLKLKNKIILTGQLKRTEVLEYMKNSDVFILNTQYEGFSHILIEASNLKIPIITTDVGGNPEIIENNKQGILIKPNDKEAIKSAIVKILQDNNFKQKIIKNAYEKSKQFSIKSTLDNLEKILK